MELLATRALTFNEAHTYHFKIPFILMSSINCTLNCKIVFLSCISEVLENYIAFLIKDSVVYNDALL